MAYIDLKTWLPQYNFTVDEDILTYDGCCAFSVIYNDDSDEYNITWYAQDIPLTFATVTDEECAKQYIIDCIEEYDDAMRRDV